MCDISLLYFGPLCNRFSDFFLPFFLTHFIRYASLAFLREGRTHEENAPLRTSGYQTPFSSLENAIMNKLVIEKKIHNSNSIIFEQKIYNIK